jgi:hypothetical protein
MKTFKELKSELKTLAQEIRTGKSQRKSLPNGYVHGLASDRESYRIKHIAYCLARGRTMEQIEAKVAPENVLSKWQLERIDKLIKELTFVEEPKNEQI